MIQYHGTREPYIKWKHIDGPMLTCSDGSMYWLTWFEQFQFKFGFTNIEKLNRKYTNG